MSAARKHNRHKSLRVSKTFDEFTFKFGNAGFVVGYKNGIRLKKFNTVLKFNQRRKNK